MVLAAGRPGCTTCQTLQCTRVHGNGTQCMVMVPRYPQSINFMQANRHHFPIDEKGSLYSIETCGVTLSRNADMQKETFAVSMKS